MAQVRASVRPRAAALPWPLASGQADWDESVRSLRREDAQNGGVGGPRQNPRQPRLEDDEDA